MCKTLHSRMQLDNALKVFFSCPQCDSHSSFFQQDWISTPSLRLPSGTPGKMPSAEVARKSNKLDGTAKQIFNITLLDAMCRFLPKSMQISGAERCGSQSLLEKRPHQECPWKQGGRRENQRTEFSNSQAAFARENHSPNQRCHKARPSTA